MINFDPEAGVEVDLLVAKFTDDFPFYDKEEKSKKALDFFRVGLIGQKLSFLQLKPKPPPEYWK